MDPVASRIISLTIVYSTVYSDADQRKHQSSASLAFVWGIHRGPVNSPHKWPVTQKMFPFDDVIIHLLTSANVCMHIFDSVLIEVECIAFYSIIALWILHIRAYLKLIISKWVVILSSISWLHCLVLVYLQLYPICYDIHGITQCFYRHDDVIKWKHFSRNWPFVRGIHRSRRIPHTKPVTRRFDIFFDLRLNKRLSEQTWGWRFETPSWL